MDDASGSEGEGVVAMVEERRLEESVGRVGDEEADAASSRVSNQISS